MDTTVLEIAQAIVTALSLAAAIFGLLGKHKNKQMLEAVISGVEKATGILNRSTRKQIKETIQSEAVVRGVSEPLHRAVKKQTGNDKRQE